MTIGNSSPSSQATVDRILGAAIDEFAEHGLAGARVDRIAERAEANKQLLYRYFGTKQDLFRAAVRAMARRFGEVRRALPAAPEDRLPYYFEQATDDQQWVRLLEWEALQSGNGPAVDETERRAQMARAVDAVRADQAAGVLVADVWSRTGPPWRGKFAADGFHPGALGYADWAAAFTDVLGAALSPRLLEPKQPPHRLGSQDP